MSLTSIHQEPDGSILIRKDTKPLITQIPNTSQINSIASNASGMQIVSVTNGGPIYISTDAGKSWIAKENSTKNWTCVSCNSTGEKIFATTSDKGIWASKDYGTTFNRTSASRIVNWKTIASDSTGQILVAGSTENIYYSNDSGKNWLVTGSILNKSITASACISNVSDKSFAVITSVGEILISTNNGITWRKTSAPISNWTSIAANVNGTQIVATQYNGKIWYSLDASGAVWTSYPSSPTLMWTSITSDITGQYLAASTVDSKIYTSSDSGLYWNNIITSTTTNYSPPYRWYSITSGGTNTTFAFYAGGNNSADKGVIYTYPTYKTNLTVSGGVTCESIRYNLIDANGNPTESVGYVTFQDVDLTPEMVLTTSRGRFCVELTPCHK